MKVVTRQERILKAAGLAVTAFVKHARALYPDDRENQEAFIRDCVNQVQVDLHRR